MAFVRQLSAKDEFKKLIVISIADAKNVYNALEYNKFFNAVEMIDSLMITYKNDVQFIGEVQQLKTAYTLASKGLDSYSYVTDISQPKFIEKVNYYRAYFTALIDLASRTVFAGRDTDVDIDLEEVFKSLGDFFKQPEPETQIEKKEEELPNGQ